MDEDELGRVLDTLAALGDHEATLAGLYTACSTAWRHDAVLWDGLADSERGHADCLAMMAQIAVERPGGFAPRRPFNAAAGRLQAGYVEARTREVESGGMARRTALLMARDIEHSIIETRLNELLETRERDYPAIADGIVAETGLHYRLLEQQLLVVARLLLANPRFAFLDRPSTTLSPEQVDWILGMLRERSITYITFEDEKNGLNLEHFDALLELEKGGAWTCKPIKGGQIVEESPGAAG